MTLLMVAACADLIGADFSDLRPRPNPDAAGGGGGGGLGGGGAGGPSDAEDASTEVSHAGGSGSAGSAGSGGGMGGAGAADAQPDSIARDGAADEWAMAEAAIDGLATDAGPDVSVVEGGFDATADAVADRDSESNDVADGREGAATDGRSIGIVTINELNAQGAIEDFIELHNYGTGSFDLGGHSVTQASGATGSPDPSGFLTFIAGTTLGPGQHLFIVGNQTSRGGPHSPCNVSGFPSVPCYYVDWGISKTEGERVYFLAPNNSVIEYADFPGPDGGQPPSGRSWGRYPDGMGAFQHTIWTPGSPNQL